MRPTPEEIEEIREILNLGAGVSDREALMLLSEIDALKLEISVSDESIRAFGKAFDSMKAERDRARGEVEALTEAGNRALTPCVWYRDHSFPHTCGPKHMWQLCEALAARQPTEGKENA